MQHANEIDYTFNWFYADDQDTGYFVSGLDPVRPSNVDPTLPTWGTGIAEWQGFLSQDQHVHQTNKDYFVSWNNKPAPGFAAADDQYGYGAVYRSQLLVDQLQAQFASHPSGVQRSDVVKAMSFASTQDLDGTSVMPLLLQYLQGHSEPAGVQAMLDQLSSWVSDGAHRLKANPSDTQYQQAAAVAIADELMPNLIRGAVRLDPGRGRAERRRVHRGRVDAGLRGATDAVREHAELRRGTPRQRVRRRVRELPGHDADATARRIAGRRVR